MSPPKKSLELSLDAILARCIFDNKDSSTEFSPSCCSKHSLMKVSLSLNDLITASKASSDLLNKSSANVDNTNYRGMISPLGSSIDLTCDNSLTQSYLTSEWDSIYSGNCDSRILYEPSVKTELAVAWDDTAVECHYPVKTELRILWYGYPIPRPKTPDVIYRFENMKYNCSSLESDEDLQV